MKWPVTDPPAPDVDLPHNPAHWEKDGPHIEQALTAVELSVEGTQLEPPADRLHYQLAQLEANIEGDRLAALELEVEQTTLLPDVHPGLSDPDVTPANLDSFTESVLRGDDTLADPFADTGSPGPTPFGGDCGFGSLGV